MLAWTVRSRLGAGVRHVFVVRGMSAVAVATDDTTTVACNSAPERGMFSSIQVGLRASMTTLGHAEVALVLPGDMPFMQSESIVAVLRAAALGECGVTEARGAARTPRRAALGGRRGVPRCGCHVDAAGRPPTVTTGPGAQ